MYLWSENKLLILSRTDDTRCTAISRHILNAHSSVRVPNGNHGFIVWKNIVIDRDNGTKSANDPTKNVFLVWKIWNSIILAFRRDQWLSNYWRVISSEPQTRSSIFYDLTAEPSQNIRWRQCGQRERSTVTHLTVAINGTRGRTSCARSAHFFLWL